MVNRDELLDKYAAACVDGMDFDTLWTYALETMRRDLDTTYTTDELVAEVSEYYPHLLEQ